jgi:hypothetical protein
VTIVIGYYFVCGILKRYPLSEKGGFKGAGTIIGILERILTLTFVLIGEYTAIAIIFTAKSITRFDELKNRKFSEYYLIGTLSSILFAVIMGIITIWILGEL